MNPMFRWEVLAALVFSEVLAVSERSEAEDVPEQIFVALVKPEA